MNFCLSFMTEISPLKLLKQELKVVTITLHFHILHSFRFVGRKIQRRIYFCKFHIHYLFYIILYEGGKGCEGFWYFNLMLVWRLELEIVFCKLSFKFCFGLFLGLGVILITCTLFSCYRFFLLNFQLFFF